MAPKKKKKQANRLTYAATNSRGAYARKFSAKWGLESHDEFTVRTQHLADIKLRQNNIKELEQKLAEATSALELSDEACISSDHETQYRGLQEQQQKLQTAINNMVANLTRLIQHLKTADASSELLDKLSAEVALFADVESVLGDRFTNLGTQIEQLEQQLANQKSQLESEYAQKLKSQGDEADRKARETLQERTRQVSQRLVDQKSLLNSEHEKKVNEVRHQAGKTLKEQTSQFESHVKSQLAEQKSRLDSEHKAQIDEVSGQAGKTLTERTNHFVSQLAKQKSQLEIEHKKQVDEVSRQAGKTLTERTNQFESQLAKQKSQLEIEHTKQVDEVRRQAGETLKAQISQLESQHATQLREQLMTCKADVRRELSVKHANQLAIGKQALEGYFESRRQQQISDAEGEVRRNLISEHKQALISRDAEQQRKQTQAVEEAKEQLRKELEAAHAEQLEKQRKEQERVHEAALETAKAELKRTLESTHSQQLSLAKNKSSSEHKTIKDQAAKDLRQAQVEHEATLAAARKKLREELLATHATDLEGKIKKAKTEVQRELAQEHATAQSQLQAQLAGTKQELVVAREQLQTQTKHTKIVETRASMLFGTMNSVTPDLVTIQPLRPPDVDAWSVPKPEVEAFCDTFTTLVRKLNSYANVKTSETRFLWQSNRDSTGLRVASHVACEKGLAVTEDFTTYLSNNMDSLELQMDELNAQLPTESG